MGAAWERLDQLFPRRFPCLVVSKTTCLSSMNRLTPCVPSFSMIMVMILLTAGFLATSEARAFSLVQRSEQAEQLVAQGSSALERGDENAAKVFFQRALVIDPNNSAAHTYMGIFADRAGHLMEAEKHFAAAVNASPSSPGPHNNHGAILLRLGRVDQAALEFETSLRLDSNQPSALVNLAQIRFASGKPEDFRVARELFIRATQIAPDAEIARALIVIALRLKDNEGAKRSFNDYVSLISHSPTISIALPKAREELGAALLDAGLAEEAIKELEAAVNSDPSSVSATILLARAYQAHHETPAAGRTLEAAVARGLDAAPIYAQLAEIYELSGHVESAIPAMRLAIQRDPANESYRFRYGMLLTDTKAPAAAVMRIHEALEAFPHSVRLWFALGVAQSALDKSQDAAEAFNRAVEIDPKFAPALAYLGMVNDQQGHYAEALVLYERALAIDDSLAGAHYLAADVQLRQTTTDFASAEQHLKRAIALDPSFIQPRLTLARLYLRTAQLNQASNQLKELIANDPNVAEAHYLLGRIFMRLKQRSEAQTELALFKSLSERQREEGHDKQREIARRLANVRF
jgi:Tfp pilus assembly protein PilF